MRKRLFFFLSSAVREAESPYRQIFLIELLKVIANNSNKYAQIYKTCRDWKHIE